MRRRRRASRTAGGRVEPAVEADLQGRRPRRPRRAPGRPRPGRADRLLAEDRLARRAAATRRSTWVSVDEQMATVSTSSRREQLLDRLRGPRRGRRALGRRRRGVDHPRRVVPAISARMPACIRPMRPQPIRRCGAPRPSGPLRHSEPCIHLWVPHEPRPTLRSSLGLIFSLVQAARPLATASSSVATSAASPDDGPDEAHRLDDLGVVVAHRDPGAGLERGVLAVARLAEHRSSSPGPAYCVARGTTWSSPGRRKSHTHQALAPVHLEGRSCSAHRRRPGRPRRHADDARDASAEIATT